MALMALQLAGSAAGFNATLPKVPVLFEVYPAPTCPNCRMMMQEGFLPLLQSGLPGDRVNVVILPWGSGEMGPDGRYDAQMGSPYDQLSSTQMCAMQALGLSPQPQPVDSPKLLSMLRFMLCDMWNIQSHGPRGENELKDCARRAGIPWDGPEGLGQCQESGHGLKLMRGARYSSWIGSVFRRHLTNPPYLFLNSEPLECPGPTYCTSTWTPAGSRLLPLPGSLADVACSLLDPKPAACRAAAPELVTTATLTVTKYCENCWEVGRFRFDLSTNEGREGALILAVAATMVSTAALALSLVRSRYRPPAEDTLLVQEMGATE